MSRLAASRCGLWMVSAVVLSWSAAVRADTFAIVPPWYAGADGKVVSAEIARIIQEDLSKHNEALGPQQVLALVPKHERVSCEGGACAERYREASGAIAAVVIRVDRLGVGAGPATSFQIGIQPAIGVEYKQGAVLSDGALPEIVLKAFHEVYRQYRQGPGPWLELAGGPDGATVYVDNRVSGKLPCTLAVPVGAHLVRVEARGFEPTTRMVGLESVTDRAKLDIRLESARVTLGGSKTAEKPVPVAPPVGRDNVDQWWEKPLPWGVGGGAVLAGGAVLLGFGARNKGRVGECANHGLSGVSCPGSYQSGADTTAMLIGGGMLAGAGVAMITWSVMQASKVRKKNPLQVGVDVGASRFQLVIGSAL